MGVEKVYEDADFDLRVFTGDDAQKIIRSLAAAEGEAPPIARAFVKRLRETVTPAILVEIDRRNGAASPGAKCASHDFCDATKLMLLAFYDAGALKPTERFDQNDFRHYALWNCAWDIAIESEIPGSLNE